ncbi:Neuropeptides capa receptor, partial [Frankliniella fusca]
MLGTAPAANASVLLPGPGGAPAVPGVPGLGFTVAHHLPAGGQQTHWHDLFYDTVMAHRPRDASPTAAQPECCYFFQDVVEFLHQYYVPVMIVMGLVGNLLSCVVFLNTHLRLRSSSYYLAALATADFGYLAVLVLVWLNSVHGVQVFDKEGWCQIVTYVSSVCAFLSVWLIVAFTVERFIAVQYPLHRPHMCTVARAKAIVACIAVFALVAHIYTLKTRGMVRDKASHIYLGSLREYKQRFKKMPPEGYESCDLLDQHQGMMRVINLVDAIVTLVVPIILIIVMNTMITRNLVLFGRRFKQAPPGAPGADQSSWTDPKIGRESCESSSSGSGGAANRRLTTSVHGSFVTISKEGRGHGHGQQPKGGAAKVHVGLGQGLGQSLGQSLATPPSQESSTLPSAKPPGLGHVPGPAPAPTLASSPAHGLGLGLSLAPSAIVTGQRSQYSATGLVRSKQQPIQISTGRTLVSTRTQQSITKMLLLISSVFILLNLPSHVLRVYASIAVLTGSNVATTTSPALWFGQQLAMLLYYTNFSINFLLYSMCGITFRRCLWQLVRGAARYFGCGCGSRWSDCQFSGALARVGVSGAARRAGATEAPPGPRDPREGRRSPCTRSETLSELELSLCALCGDHPCNVSQAARAAQQAAQAAQQQQQHLLADGLLLGEGHELLGEQLLDVVSVMASRAAGSSSPSARSSSTPPTP